MKIAFLSFCSFILILANAPLISNSGAAEPTASPSPKNASELNMHHEKKTPKARVVGVKPEPEAAPGVHTGSGASDLNSHQNGSSVGAGIQIPLSHPGKSQDEDEEADDQKKASDQ